jgi:hypothetical protein
MTPWPERCVSCGSNEWQRIVIPTEGPVVKLCRNCISGVPKGTPDVYFNPKDGATQYEPNIADPKTGDPIPFYDKRSKLEAMRKAGVREAGDHGPRHATQVGKTKYFI